VQDLLKKIEADAQEHLPLPLNADTAEKLARYKGFLKVETHRLKLLHRSGGSEKHPVGTGAKGVSAARARRHRRLRPRGIESAQRH